MVIIGLWSNESGKLQEIASWFIKIKNLCLFGMSWNFNNWLCSVQPKRKVNVKYFLYFPNLFPEFPPPFFFFSELVIFHRTLWLWSNTLVFDLTSEQDLSVCNWNQLGISNFIFRLTMNLLHRPTFNCVCFTKLENTNWLQSVDKVRTASTLHTT